MKDSTFIASPMLEILSQIEIKSNWFPMTLFLVNIHSTRHLENLLSQNNITSWYFLIVSAKSVEVPIELSEDCYGNLSVPISNGQTLDELKYCPQWNKINYLRLSLTIYLFSLTEFLGGSFHPKRRKGGRG